MRYYSVAIILGISLLVFGAATMVLHNCLNDPNSNIKVVEHVAYAAFNPPFEVAKVTEPAPFDSIDKEVASMDILTNSSVFCKEELPQLEGISITDFLKRHDMPSKYSERIELAKEYGIEDYTGSAAENLLLMNSIQADLHTAACK